MCKLCEKNPVYEFTNKRKLCKKCFIIYFQKKVLYTIRKFNMIKKGDIIGYKKENGFKGIVLEEILDFINKRADFTLVRLPNKKANKIAVDSSIDSEAKSIIQTLISGDISLLKRYMPLYENMIKPLYLFLNEEISLYAKLKGLKFKPKKEGKDRIRDFTDEFEEKHPEIKRAVINSLLALYPR